MPVVVDPLQNSPVMVVTMVGPIDIVSDQDALHQSTAAAWEEIQTPTVYRIITLFHMSAIDYRQTLRLLREEKYSPDRPRHFEIIPLVVADELTLNQFAYATGQRHFDSIPVFSTLEEAYGHIQGLVNQRWR